MTESNHLREDLTRKDARIIMALEAAIADPATPSEDCAECREDLGSIAMGYVDVLNDEDLEEYLWSALLLAAAGSFFSSWVCPTSAIHDNNRDASTDRE